MKRVHYEINPTLSTWSNRMTEQKSRVGADEASDGDANIELPWMDL
jgi:hypothetical protein